MDDEREDVSRRMLNNLRKILFDPKRDDIDIGSECCNSCNDRTQKSDRKPRRLDNNCLECSQGPDDH